MVQHKVLIITDSLGFPRSEPEVVLYENSYVALLKAAFPQCDFIHHGCGGATIVKLFNYSAYYHKTLVPDLCFIQSGIVDCAPRALKEIEIQIINRLPLLRHPLTYITRRYTNTLRKVRQLTYTSEEVFEDYLCRFEDIFKNIYWIEILPASDVYENKVQGIGSNIERYNKIIRKHNHISTNCFTASEIMSDFHHLNSNGHNRLFQKISKVIHQKLGFLPYMNTKEITPSKIYD